MTTTITASAPGKLVLLGDHAAVYGYPCLVTAVDLRFSVTIEKHDTPIIEIDTPDLRAQSKAYQVARDALDAHNQRETAFVEAALKQFIQHFPVQGGFRVVTDGPRTTYGLGSSSAITAAVLAAAAELEHITLSPRELFDLAYAAILDVQHTGSGVDLAAAVYGGTLYYVNKGEVIEPLAVSDLPLVIGYSGSKVSTTNLIAQVAELRGRHPQLLDALLQMLGQITTDGQEAARQSDWRSFGDLMNIHQGILDSFGVNTLPLARLIFATREAGAYGAKLSGAGGGDCMFAVVQKDTRTAVESAIERAGGLPVQFRSGVEGVRIE